MRPRLLRCLKATRRLAGQETEALSEPVEDFLGRPHLAPFCLRDSFVKVRALLRLVERLEQFDDLGLGFGHNEIYNTHTSHG